MKMLWMTDLHLDRAEKNEQRNFIEKLRGGNFDVAVITGDISHSRRLPDDLLVLGEACEPRLVCFVLGNHDFHGSSFSAVDAVVADVCRRKTNLCHLGQGRPLRLSDNAAVLGHRGWADYRAGYGKMTRVPSYDAPCIKDFEGASQKEVFDRMEELGAVSARYFREVLPYALTCYKEIWVATHVPPFKRAAYYNGGQCGHLHIPHYTNIAAGSAIRGIANNFRRSRVTVLCGHTHNAVVYRASETVEVYTGKSIPGKPRFQRLFDVAD